MDNIDHISEVIQHVNDLMRKLDEIPCPLNNQLLLYHRFAVSQLLWHFTVADLGTTWVAKDIENLVYKYIRQWL